MSLHQSASNLLDQIDRVVAQLSDDEYRTPLSILSHSSIGQHVRHTLEFFICLIEARNSGIINYDSRRHDPFIEQEVVAARNIIKSIQNFLNNREADQPLKMEANYEIEEINMVLVPSSFYRELAYTMEHAIHHMALIKIGLRTAYSYVALPEHFGVASSTVRYQLQQKTE